MSAEDSQPIANEVRHTHKDSHLPPHVHRSWPNNRARHAEYPRKLVNDGNSVPLASSSGRTWWSLDAEARAAHPPHTAQTRNTQHAAETSQRMRRSAPNRQNSSLTLTRESPPSRFNRFGRTIGATTSDVIEIIDLTDGNGTTKGADTLPPPREEQPVSSSLSALRSFPTRSGNLRLGNDIGASRSHMKLGDNSRGMHRIHDASNPKLICSSRSGVLRLSRTDPLPCPRYLDSSGHRVISRDPRLSEPGRFQGGKSPWERHPSHPRPGEHITETLIVPTTHSHLSTSSIPTPHQSLDASQCPCVGIIDHPRESVNQSRELSTWTTLEPASDDMPTFINAPMSEEVLELNSVEIDELAKDDYTSDDEPLVKTTISAQRSRSKEAVSRLDLDDQEASNGPISDLGPLISVKSSVSRTDVSDGTHGTICVPREPHDKTRCILPFSSRRTVVVSRHGYLDEIDTGSWVYSMRLRVPSLPGPTSVEDACMLRRKDTYLGVFAHATGKYQLSIVNFDSLSTSISICRPSASNSANPAASAVCPMLELNMFASGGYDHIVHLWTMYEDRRAPSAEKLEIKHQSIVHALLAIKDTSQKLVSGGADRAANIYDLSSARVVRTLNTSNAIYNVHEASPFCLLLEVGHRELQFEIRDYRAVPQQPVQRFGYNTSKVHGRYVKGDIRDHLFACGDNEGTVRFWDTRNLSRPAHVTACFVGTRAVQTVFAGANIIACSTDGQLVTIPSPR